MVVKLATCLQRDTPHLAVVVRGIAPARSVHAKALVDQLFALLPKGLRALRIEGVRLHTLTHARGGGELGDVAILAIASANRLGVRNAGSPQGRGRALGNALIAKGRSTFGLTGID